MAATDVKAMRLGNAIRALSDMDEDKGMTWRGVPMACFTKTELRKILTSQMTQVQVEHRLYEQDREMRRLLEEPR